MSSPPALATSITRRPKTPSSSTGSAQGRINEHGQVESSPKSDTRRWSPIIPYTDWDYSGAVDPIWQYSGAELREKMEYERYEEEQQNLSRLSQWDDKGSLSRKSKLYDHQTHKWAEGPEGRVRGPEGPWFRELREAIRHAQKELLKIAKAKWPGLVRDSFHGDAELVGFGNKEMNLGWRRSRWWREPEQAGWWEQNFGVPWDEFQRLGLGWQDGESSSGGMVRVRNSSFHPHAWSELGHAAKLDEILKNLQTFFITIKEEERVYEMAALREKNMMQAKERYQKLWDKVRGVVEQEINRQKKGKGPASPSPPPQPQPTPLDSPEIDDGNGAGHDAGKGGDRDFEPDYEKLYEALCKVIQRDEFPEETDIDFADEEAFRPIYERKTFVELESWAWDSMRHERGDRKREIEKEREKRWQDAIKMPLSTETTKQMQADHAHHRMQRRRKMENLSDRLKDKWEELKEEGPPTRWYSPNENGWLDEHMLEAMCAWKFGEMKADEEKEFKKDQRDAEIRAAAASPGAAISDNVTTTPPGVRWSGIQSGKTAALASGSRSGESREGATHPSRQLRLYFISPILLLQTVKEDMNGTLADRGITLREACIQMAIEHKALQPGGGGSGGARGSGSGGGGGDGGGGGGGGDAGGSGNGSGSGGARGSGSGGGSGGRSGEGEGGGGRGEKSDARGEDGDGGDGGQALKRRGLLGVSGGRFKKLFKHSFRSGGGNDYGGSPGGSVGPSSSKLSRFGNKSSTQELTGAAQSQGTPTRLPAQRTHAPASHRFGTAAGRSTSTTGSSAPVRHPSALDRFTFPPRPRPELSPRGSAAPPARPSTPPPRASPVDEVHSSPEPAAIEKALENFKTG